MAFEPEISDPDFATLALECHQTRPQRNYTIRPRS